MHKWSREVEHKLTRLENWISCAKTFFSDENLKILKGLSPAERLKLEIDRLNMASLSRLELRAANEQLRSVLQSKKIPEQKIITAKENGRISAGMNAFRRLTGT